MLDAAEGDMEVCDLRLAFDILAEKFPGVDPLHLAVMIGNKQAVVQILLSAGAPIEARDKHGNTALQIAILCGNDIAVQQLLAAGANMEVEAAAFSQGTALHLAIVVASCQTNTQKQHEVAVKVIKTLLAAGAELEARDGMQRTPLHLATEGYFHIPTSRQQQNAMEAVVQILLAAGADVNAKTHNQQTVLHDAVAGGHLAMMRRLLAAGADPEARDIDGMTPLRIAFAGMRPGAAAVLLQARAWHAFLPEI